MLLVATVLLVLEVTLWLPVTDTLLPWTTSSTLTLVNPLPSPFKWWKDPVNPITSPLALILPLDVMWVKE